jgi:hypothetical protein
MLPDAQLEHEIRRETLAVATHLFVEALSSDPVEAGELGVEQDPVSAQHED